MILVLNANPSLTSPPTCSKFDCIHTKGNPACKKGRNQLWRDSTSPFQCRFNPIQSKLCYCLTKLPWIYQLKVEVLWPTWISHEKDIFCSQILLLMVEITFTNHPKIFKSLVPKIRQIPVFVHNVVNCLLAYPSQQIPHLDKQMAILPVF